MALGERCSLHPNEAMRSLFRGLPTASGPLSGIVVISVSWPGLAAGTSPGIGGFRTRKHSRLAWFARFLITGQGSGRLLLDIFAGSATSLLVAAERGLDAVGIELLPYAQWAADAVVRAHTADVAMFRSAVDAAAEAARSGASSGPPGLSVPAASWAVSDEVSSALLALREALPARGSGVEADLAHLALVSVVESVSMAVKDGTSLRHRDRERKGRTTRPGRKGQQFKATGVVDAFAAAANVIADDLAKMPGGTEARVLWGTHAACHLGMRLRAVLSLARPTRIGMTIRRSTSWNWLRAASCEGPQDLRRIRKSLLRSHLEAPPPDSLLSG